MAGLSVHSLGLGLFSFSSTLPSGHVGMLTHSRSFLLSGAHDHLPTYIPTWLLSTLIVASARCSFVFLSVCLAGWLVFSLPWFGSLFLSTLCARWHAPHSLTHSFPHSFFKQDATLYLTLPYLITLLDSTRVRVRVRPRHVGMSTLPHLPRLPRLCSYDTHFVSFYCCFSGTGMGLA